MRLYKLLAIAFLLQFSSTGIAGVINLNHPDCIDSYTYITIDSYRQILIETADLAEGVADQRWPEINTVPLRDTDAIRYFAHWLILADESPFHIKVIKFYKVYSDDVGFQQAMAFDSFVDLVHRSLYGLVRSRSKPLIIQEKSEEKKIDRWPPHVQPHDIDTILNHVIAEFQPQDIPQQTGSTKH